MCAKSIMWWRLVDWNATLEVCNTDLVVASRNHDKHMTHLYKAKKKSDSGCLVKETLNAAKKHVIMLTIQHMCTWTMDMWSFIHPRREARVVLAVGLHRTAAILMMKK